MDVLDAFAGDFTVLPGAAWVVDAFAGEFTVLPDAAWVVVIFDDLEMVTKIGLEVFIDTCIW